MADCEQYELLLSAELDGELSEEEKCELQAHLAECPSCLELREAMQLAVTSLRDELTDAPPELLKGIRYKMSLGKKKFGLHVLEWRFTALAAVICLSVFGILKLIPNFGKSEAAEPMLLAVDSYTVSNEAALAALPAPCTVSGPAEDGSASPTEKKEKLRLPVHDEADAEEDPGASENEPMEQMPKSAQSFFYAADTQRGYGAYNQVQGKADYYGIYILYYAAPECILENEDCQCLESDEEEDRWQIPLSMCHKLEDECLADEIYYGDLMSSQGLAIILKNGADDDGND